MGDITGPISSLPGSVHAVPVGAMCDEHQDLPAVLRVQGETDSFGSEMHDLCQMCVDAEKAYRCSEAGKADAASERIGICDWCRNAVADLRNARDYDEGMSGPVYRVCGPCIKRQNDEAEEYLSDAGDWYD